VGAIIKYRIVYRDVLCINLNNDHDVVNRLGPITQIGGVDTGNDG
jgi:hypothetical protein